MEFSGKGTVDGINYECLQDGLVYKVSFAKDAITGSFEIPTHLAGSALNPVDLIRNHLFCATCCQSNIDHTKFFPDNPTYFV